MVIESSDTLVIATSSRIPWVRDAETGLESAARVFTVRNLHISSSRGGRAAGLTRPPGRGDFDTPPVTRCVVLVADRSDTRRELTRHGHGDRWTRRNSRADVAAERQSWTELELGRV